MRRPLLPPSARLAVWLAAGLAGAAAAEAGSARGDAGAGLPEPEFDSHPPPVLPDAPGGAFGFTRYVFSELDGRIVTTLVEGPRGEQVRCQREDQPCSYLDLKALHESGEPVPEALAMSRAELAELVGQLDTVSATLARYESIDRACAEGYRVSSEQNPNMGIHMTSYRNVSDGVFDPARPEMLPFAMEGGEKLGKDEIGRCVDGAWTGDPRQRIVGAAFVLPTDQFGENHPEGFAGPIDNWHVHYYSCVGTRSDAILTEAQCRARGGQLVEKAGWMIHTYAQPEFDSQAGVFSMWNPSIWPRVEGGDRVGAPRGAGAMPEGGARRPIRNFSFGAPIEVEAGQSFTVVNEDSVPHTLTAGTPTERSAAFESGSLVTGQAFSAKLAEPGEYPFFCAHHTFMTGVVVVR